MTTSNAGTLGSTTSPGQQSFVINLCSSTSPMALTHPSSPELKRYTFFVSRQREDGRERFRLHMGYFDSQETAEELLVAVRDVYPAAWAGPAPTQGVTRRGRIAPVQLAAGVAQAANVTAPSPAPAPGPTPTPAVTPAPVVSLAPVVAPAPVAAATAPEAHAAAMAAPAAAAGQPADQPLEQTMSEMRTVLAQLGDEAPTTVAPTVKMPQPLPPLVKPVRPVEPPRLHPVSQPRVAAKQAAAPSELTPVQTLKVLEGGAASATTDSQKVRVLTPEDTQTLRDIKLDKDNNAPPCFAVQLIWSVTPIDADAMPHLAIFDAYTLYNVEGSREGRKWYGLRLGFFSDPNSATQVANYVRSDYGSVAVVPVSTRERDRAGGGSAISPADSGISPPLKASEQLSTNREAMDGFELVADDRPVPQKRDIDAPARTEASAAAARVKAIRTLNPVGIKPAAPAAKAAGAGKPTGKRVVVRKRPDVKIQGAPGSADVLESTLELLGASTLTLDEGAGMVIDAAAARRADAKKPSNNRFSRLLSRLGGG